MNRVAKSYILDILPVFKNANVGNILWGLVNGKTQTHLPWGHRPEQLPYTGEWQHDIFKGDFTPYDQKEIKEIRALSSYYIRNDINKVSLDSIKYDFLTFLENK